MERLRSDRRPNLIEGIVTNLAEMLGIKYITEYSLHPQANRAGKRWNRTLARDISSFLSTSSDNCGKYVTLAYFRYNTNPRETIKMTPFKAMSVVDELDSWSELDIENEKEKQTSLVVWLSFLNKQLIGEVVRARTRAAEQYKKVVRLVRYDVGNLVVVWSTKLAKREGNKL